MPPSASYSGTPPPSLRQWWILFRAYFRIQKTKLIEAVSRSRLKTVTIICFLAIYIGAAYFLLDHGFRFISNLPAAGSLIVDRLIHVVFFCFMVMLIFSSAVTAYISIYRGRDVGWLMSLPVSHRVLFLWKSFESALFSTWSLLVIMAPLLISFARQRDVSLYFYLKSSLALLPFLVICCALGTILLIVVGRYLNRRQFAVLAAIAGLSILVSVGKTALADQEAIRSSGYSTAFAFQKVLGHTNLATNRAIPSTWLASSIVEWSQPYSKGRGWLMPCLLVSNALMLPLFLSFLSRRWFYPSWNRSIQSNAASANARLNSGNGSGEITPLKHFGFLPSILGLPMGAVAKKDWLTFIREPAQWAQFTLVFGLLAIYSSGLDNMHDQLDQPRDLYLVAFLNLSVSALALSTLTTRFVFPQFSLEGQKLWILAMSPIKLSGIVMQKFVTSTLATGIAVTIILLLSSHSLRFDRADTLFFSLAMVMLSTGLNALAVGLGVIFPNLNESNTAKIVSGFGGTLCLVASFLYIICFILILVFIRSSVFYQNQMVEGWFLTRKAAIGFGFASLLAIVTTVLPLVFARQKLKHSGIAS